MDIVYLDFAKTFDTVSHPKLISKLSHCGVRGVVLDWISELLHCRSQVVKIDNVKSNSIPVISGVPQGSVLGPLLFLIYVNDIVDSVKYATIELFADDCKVYASTDLVEQVTNFQLDLSNIYNWSSASQLVLSTPKCSVLSLGHNGLFYSYDLGGATLRAEDTVRDLGVIVDKRLKFKEHIPFHLRRGTTIRSI